MEQAKQIEPTQPIQLQINQVVTIALVAIAILGYTAWNFYNISESRAKEISQLKSDVQDLQGDLIVATQKNEQIKQEKQAVESDLYTTQSAGELVADLFQYMTAKFDELDAILLETDKNSLQAIEWFTDNGLFTDTASASYVYGRWQTTQAKTDRDYAALMKDVRETFDAFQALVN